MGLRADFHPHTASYLCMFIVPAGTSTTWLSRTQFLWVAYSFFSLGYGKDIHPLGLLGASNPPTTEILLLLAVLTLSYFACGARSTWPTLLKTLIKDSALYFLVVIISHSLIAILYMWAIPCV